MWWLNCSFQALSDVCVLRYKHLKKSVGLHSDIKVRHIFSKYSVCMFPLCASRIRLLFFFNLSQKTLKMLIQDINRNLQISGAVLYLLRTGSNMLAFFFQADI